MWHKNGSRGGFAATRYRRMSSTGRIIVRMCRKAEEDGRRQGTEARTKNAVPR
jgi:hypothetical protein